MEVKVFKKQGDLTNFIKEIDEDKFHKILKTEKTLFRTINKVLIFTHKDVEEYVVTQFYQILTIFAIDGIQHKIYLNENRFYLKVIYEKEHSLLVQKYGYIISAIQNLLASYVFSKFAKWYHVSINVNNHLHNQKYFLKKQIYFAIKNIKDTSKPFHFKPMPNDQRKLVHELVKNIDGYVSFSQGNGFLRHVVLKADE